MEEEAKGIKQASIIFQAISILGVEKDTWNMTTHFNTWFIAQYTPNEKLFYFWEAETVG